MKSQFSCFSDRAPLFLAIWGVALLFAASCVEQIEPVQTEAQSVASSAIVSGSSEPGFPGSGALVLDTGYWGGHFCSSTLIAPQWVLTAAHCLLFEFDDGTEVEPWMVSFFVGQDATYEGGGEDGISYDADSFHIHSGYNDDTLEDDIALLHLRDPVPSGVATPFELNEIPPSDDHPRTQIFWVGYGESNGTSHTGSGHRRSGWGEVSKVYTFQYEHSPDPAQPCYGDSGGSAFVVVGVEYHVAGVISGVNSDNCTGGGSDTRVDSYHNWITTTMAGGGGGTSCDLMGGDCGVQTCWFVSDDETSCWPSQHGTVRSSCNSDVDTWGTALPCEDGAYCLQTGETDADGECLAFCENDTDCGDLEICYDIFSDVEYGLCFNAPTPCEILAGDCPENEACWPSGDDEFACFETVGSAIGEDCDPEEEATDLQCVDGAVCLQVSANDAHDGECFPFCFEDTDCDEGDECYKPIFRGIDNIGVCLCRDGDDDLWCAVDDCDDTNPNINPGADEVCGDGVDNNCNDFTDEGCGCDDPDADGFCAPEDCDQGNPNINPGVAEVCDDGVDNNCNNFTDEGCGCDDPDADGFCEPDDCDQSNPNINPGAAEVCDDGVDNNCNNFTDEGCGCDDPDVDGFCEPDDCDQSNPNVNPSVAEVCDDGVDNNCNNFTDEGCWCDDFDGDHFCPPDDCDDGNPGVSPDATEICDDGVDNNCNGATDGDDTSCGGGGGGGDDDRTVSGEAGCPGSCTSARTNPTSGNSQLLMVSLLALVVVEVRVRRRRR